MIDNEAVITVRRGRNMYILITLAVGLAALIFFTEYWLYGKTPHIIHLSISCVSAIAGYFILSLFLSRGLFILSLFIGQILSLLYDFMKQGRQLLLPRFCIYLSNGAAWFPLCLCNNDIWHYAVYLATFILCAVLFFAGAENKNRFTIKISDFLVNKHIYYWVVSCIPCCTIVFYILILTAVIIPSVLSGLLLFAAFIMLQGFALWLQREISRRLDAEYLNDSMSKWQQESRDYMNTIRSQRHDFNLHLHALSGLISRGEYEQCRQYLQELVSQAADVNDIMPVYDAVVGSMLYNMREEARRHGSDIFYHITYDMKNILCNGFECNKIIGNLLQNDIEALRTAEDKEYGIKLSIFKRNGNTVIISENRFTGEPDCIARVFESGYSTKKNHDGIGLSMVLRTVERYGGRIYPEFEDDKIRFIVNVPNKVHLQKGE